MPSDTLWQLETQTEGKHLVLKYYLDGWLPILGRWNRRLLYIDGFAGPGEHAGGEPGSPIIALDCIKRQRDAGQLINVDVMCVFVESKPQAIGHLKSVLEHHVVPGTTCEVIQGEFEDHMTRILDYVDKQRITSEPTFVMVDPFGVKGSRMRLIERILVVEPPRNEWSARPQASRCAASARGRIRHTSRADNKADGRLWARPSGGRRNAPRGVAAA